jgi:PAS domain S-box-containing protein
MHRAAWLVMTFASSALAQFLQIRNYGTNAGLPQSEVVSVYQDRAGYMWLGTYESGLARYDGHFFQRSSLPDSMVNCAVNSIYQDRQNALWLGTDKGLICLQYDPAIGDTTYQIFTVAAGLPHNYVNDILADSAGVLWIGTRGGACYFSNSKFVLKTTPRGSANNYVNALALGSNGSVWAGTRDGVNIWHDDRLETLTSMDGLAHNLVQAVLCDRDGVMWLGTAAGLTRAKNGQLRTFDKKDGLRDTNISALAQDQQGRLWVGALDGLAQFDPTIFNEPPAIGAINSHSANGLSRQQIFRRLGRRQGLTVDRIAALRVDYENNLWIGTWGGGVYKLFGNYLENYLTDNGLPVAPVYSFFEDRRGRIWIGTNGGGIAIVDGDSLIIRDTRHGLPHNVVRAFDREPSGAIWIGTQQGAMRLASEDQINNLRAGQVFTRQNGLPADRINDVHCTANGEVWLATGGGGAACYSGGKIAVLNNEQELPNNVVDAIHRDRQGRLWIATLGGLLVKDGDAQKVFRRNETGLPADEVYCIFEDHEGRLWFGTRRGGIALYDDGKFKIFNSAHGLSNDVVYFINADRRQRLWFGTNAGIDGFERKTLLEFFERQNAITNQPATPPEKIKPFFHLSAVHGLADNECNAHADYLDRNGNLWFGTASGATKFYPDRLPLVTPSPRVHIQSIEADGRFYTFANDLQLQAKHAITFYFRTLSFVNENYTSSEYYLSGFDKSWLKAMDDNSARYTNLPPGDYAFQVRGANALGVSSAGVAELHVEILPPFYRTAWFIFSSLLLVGGLIYGGHRWRLRQMQKRNAELANVVEEKTRGLTEMNDFLANIKDSLPVGLLIVDDRRFVVEANQTGAALFGYRVDELNGYEIHNLLAGETLTRDMLWAALREEKRARPSSNGQLEPVTNASGIEVDGLHRTGKKFPCRVHACNVEDEHGVLRYVILTCEDISERRQLERNLFENQKQLALFDLLGGMGDILNNKLAGIQGYLDLLKNALTMGVARREDSGQITPINPVEVINWAHASAGEMNAILRQLLEFGTYLARVQAAPLDLRELLQALARRWSKILVLKLPEIPAPLWINAVPKVKAGLDEALRNSREAEATEVAVHLEQLEDQSRIRMILTDNGRGVSPELLSKVFLPFFKTKATAHSGLGLWKLRQLVQQSGGSVEINFVPRGGTQLVIVLPLATPEQISKQLEEKPQPDAN